MPDRSLMGAAKLAAGLPSPRRSAGYLAQIALDRLMVEGMSRARDMPSDRDLATIGRDLREARSLYESEGWLGHPDAYLSPPSLPDPDIERKRLVRGLEVRTARWRSDYAPRPDEPGAQRWDTHPANRTAVAWLVENDQRHDWIVCVHGAGAGFVRADLHAFRAAHLHGDLGVNLAFPVLPLHGPRRASFADLTGFLHADLTQAVFGIAQSASDVRAVIRWLRTRRGARRVGLYGISLGGYVASLVAGLEDVDLVIAGVPMTDIPRLFAAHAPPEMLWAAEDSDANGRTAREVLSVVSPLEVEPRVPHDNRFVFAGLGDRMSTAEQARWLWEHWERPRATWYSGGHLGFLWNKEVGAFVDDAVTSSGFGDRGLVTR